MKLFKFILFIFFAFLTSGMTHAAGQICEIKATQDQKTNKWASQNLEVACMLNRENYKCDDFEKKLIEENKNDFLAEIEEEKDPSEKKKLEEEMLKEERAIKNRFNRCGGAETAPKKDEETNCIVNGVNIAFKSISEIPGQISKFFKDTEKCHRDQDQKRQMIELFNVSVEDKRYKMDYNNIKDWTCGQIEKQLSSRYQAYQKNIYDERIRNINAGKKVDPLKTNNADDLPNLRNILGSITESAEIRYQCYTRSYKARIICETLVSLPAEAVMTLGVGFVAKTTISTVSKSLKSSRALKRATLATQKGEKISLFDAAKLSDRDRLKAAESLLNSKLTPEQQKAILEAHYIGAKEGRGFFSYTSDDILKKARVLKEAGFDKDQVRKLMENGITGLSPDDEFLKPMFTTLQKVMGVPQLNNAQKEALLYAYAGGLSVEKKSEMLAKAGLSTDQIKKYFDHKKATANGSIPAPTASKPSTTVSTTKPAVPTPAAVANKPMPMPTTGSSAGPTPANVAVKSEWGKKIEGGFSSDAVYTFQPGSSKDKVEAAVKDITRRLGDFDPVRQIQDDMSELYKHKRLLEEAKEKLSTTAPNNKAYQEAQVQIEKSEAYTKVYKQRCQNWYELQKAKYNYTEKIEPYLKRCLGI